MCQPRFCCGPNERLCLSDVEAGMALNVGIDLVDARAIRESVDRASEARPPTAPAPDPAPPPLEGLSIICKAAKVAANTSSGTKSLIRLGRVRVMCRAGLEWLESLC